MKAFVKRLPLLGGVAVRTSRRIRPARRRSEPFQGSEEYWRRRYEWMLDSGPGSHGKLAEFKASIVNQFVRDNAVGSAIEFGCGDGNRLKLADCPSYIGFDVSPAALSRCRKVFRRDPAKCFRLASEYRGEEAELALSLDVISHLVEDEVSEQHMKRLFESATRFVITYSSNRVDESGQGATPHVRHRRFSEWVDRNGGEWVLERRIPNRYPFAGDLREGSFSDFYIDRRTRPHAHR